MKNREYTCEKKSDTPLKTREYMKHRAANVEVCQKTHEYDHEKPRICEAQGANAEAGQNKKQIRRINVPC